MEARLASYDGSAPRTAEPRVGTHMQDLPGSTCESARPWAFTPAAIALER